MEDLVAGVFVRYPTAAIVVAGLLAAHSLALFIVNLTPTPKDDAFVRRAYTLIEWVAGVTKKAKE